MTVAVYGTLKKGYSNHRYLLDAEYQGTCKVQGFTMYEHTSGMYPYVVPSKDPIEVEVYVGANMNDLDWLEGYPEYYNRKELATPFGLAWIYYMEHKNKEADKQIEVW